ncbi:MAG: DegV family protein [Coriobacteriales bacterium]|nr:DegV family protein [Coriobacteriales bacterium]
MAIRIVSDSSSDVFRVPDVDYTTVPLKVMFGSKEYVDEAGVDCERMMLDLQNHNGPSTTSCPNLKEWLNAFEGYDEIFGVTISSGLSASYSTAVMAKQEYEAAHPDAKIHIFDSLATGPVLQLIIDKLREGILAGKTFEQIKEETIAYQKSLRILYALASLNNLARNGRVNATVARVVSALNIRIIGDASEDGQVNLLRKCRGERRTINAMVNEMGARGFTGGTVHIDHSINLAGANKLKDAIEEAFPDAKVYIHACGVLCSYYADMSGIIVGYDVA